MEKYTKLLLVVLPGLGHLGGRDRRISEFEASLIYRVSSRTARATQRQPISKKTKGKKKSRDLYKIKLG